MQQTAAVVGLSHIFPQDEYPFPRDAIAARWVEEIERPDIDVFVASWDGRILGFAALRADELIHFGTAHNTWGTGLAGQMHEEVVSLLIAGGHTSAWLRVFDRNHRARRFYEKVGWRATSQTSYGDYPPYPLLVHYEISLPSPSPSVPPRP